MILSCIPIAWLVEVGHRCGDILSGPKLLTLSEIFPSTAIFDLLLLWDVGSQSKM